MAEEIVISGISGRYSGCDSVDELRDALFDKKDLITEDESRWPLGFNGVPKRGGKLCQLNRFDAQFFGVNGIQSNHMDPQLRLMLEVAIEAVLDSGTDPASLDGTRTGVFIGAPQSETQWAVLNSGNSDFSGSILTGCDRTMLANRVSYFLNLKGPSYNLATACSSAGTALDQALLNIKQGKCEAAIVGGVCLDLNYAVSLAYKRLNMICDDGKCKFLDESADGYVRAEACSAIFVQKASDAKRIYATIVNTNVNADGYKSEGITYPSAEVQSSLMKRTLREVNVDPNLVSYIEAHGTGTPAGDPIEMEAIASVYCRDRKRPLMVGSVKTNVGHSEEASAMTSIAKVLILFENRCIPPMIHYKRPNPNIASLISEAIEPVIEKMCFDDSIVGINSFGFGGANVHILLRPNIKCNDQSSDELNIARTIPRLINVCGRTEKSVRNIMDFIENNPSKVTRGFLKLLDNISNATNMNYRSHVIAKIDQDDELAFNASEPFKSDDDKRPLWFIFSGMGSQWPAMAKELIGFGILNKSFHKVNEIVKEFDINLFDILIDEDDIHTQEIISCSLGITAVQIALIDLFNELGIIADGYVGHSLGEFVCPYAYGGLSLRQTVLLSYWRAKIIKEANTKRGLMAAVGLSWDECVKRCPEGVTPVCHNSLDSVTISGEYEVTKAFIQSLTDENIFGKEVFSCDIALHSPLIDHVKPDLLTKFKTIIPDPKLRSDKWITSSVKPDNQDKSLDCCSAEYYANNIVSSVSFHQPLQQIPENAIVVEISPHCLLQSIIKQNLGPNNPYIPLMRRNNNKGNAEMILSAIGRLYQLGLKPSISRLYPSVSYPVSRGTQSLSSLIQWDHSDEWFVPLYPDYFNPNKSQEYKVIVDLNRSEDQFYLDYQIDGRNIFPVAGYIVLIWQMISKQMSKPFNQVPIIIENLSIHRDISLKQIGQVQFTIHCNDNGKFHLKQDDELVISGKIQIINEQDRSGSVEPIASYEMRNYENSLQLNSVECYKELNLRGYEYGAHFKRIQSFDLDNNQCCIAFNDNWITFIDALLQILILTNKHRRLTMPVHIKYFECDPSKITNAITSSNTSQGDCILEACYDKDISTLFTSGIVMKGVETNLIKRNTNRQVKVIENYQFSPFTENIFDQNIRKSFDQMCQMRLESIKDILSCFDGDDNEANYSSMITNYNEGDISSLRLDSSAKLPSILDRLSYIIIGNIPYKQTVNIYQIKPNKEFITNNWFRNAIEKSFKRKYSKVDILDNDKQMCQADLLIYDRIEIFEHNNQMNPNDILFDYKDELKHNSFLIIIQRTALNPVERLITKLQEMSISSNKLCFNPDNIATEYRYECICKFQLSNILSVNLYRKVLPKPISDQTFISVKTLSYEWIDILKDKLREHESRPLGHNVWLIANDCHYNGVIGLINCLRKEPNGHRIRCMFFTSGQTNSTFNPNDYSDIIAKDLVLNIFSNGIHGVYTHNECANTLLEELRDSEHNFINVDKLGDLSSFKWFEAQHKYWPIGRESDQNLINVYYSALNFRDIMLATGKLRADALPGEVKFSDCQLGLEYSGRDEKGRRVMGIVPAQALATTVIVNTDEYIWTIPNNWSMEEASSVPMAYSTAYYALIVRGRLKSGETVLIHSGAGAVGQAAIRIVLHMGGKVFITVSSKLKQNYLMSLFPQLTESQFANSRDTTFESHIMKATNGKGVDIVLNSLSEDKLQAGVRCLAKNGRFLEIGKVDMSINNKLGKYGINFYDIIMLIKLKGMSAFLKNIEFHGILLEALFENDEGANFIDDKRRIKQLLSDGISNGAVIPIRRTLFTCDQTEEAFRFMASGKHIGKVVIKLRDEEQNQTFDKNLLMLAKPRTVFLPNKFYIIIGGLGGFGLELIQWMVGKGARNLIINSRSGLKTNYQRSCIERIRQLGVFVDITTDDITKYDCCLHFIDQINLKGQIGGIFNLAMTLHDSIFENQSQDSFDIVCRSKIQTTKNLDVISRQNFKPSDYFVVFSSLVSGRGNAGQSNYGFANSSMERICEQRRRDGLHGMAIQWGVLGDVGVLAENMGEKDVVIAGSVPQKIDSCLVVLDRFLQSSESVLCSHVRAVSDEVTEVVTKELNLMERVCKVLGIRDHSGMSPTTTLAEMGMDSLVVNEVKLIFDAIGKNYSTNELRNLTIREIVSLNN